RESSGWCRSREGADMDDESAVDESWPPPAFPPPAPPEPSASPPAFPHFGGPVATPGGAWGSPAPGGTWGQPVQPPIPPTVVPPTALPPGMAPPPAQPYRRPEEVLHYAGFWLRFFGYFVDSVVLGVVVRVAVLIGLLFTAV